MATKQYAQWFRGSTPYISAHRDKTFVVLLPGEAVAHVNLTNIVHDLALLHVLGVRLVVVHGARPQIDAALPESTYHGHRRVTDGSAMTTITGIYGQIRTQLEALFSTGLPNTPLHNVEVPVFSGNFVVAKPVGIVDGVDHLFTGAARRIEKERLWATLSNGGIVVQSPIGFSSSGQAFNLPAEELAADIAIRIKADKLIMLSNINHVCDDQGQRVSTLTPTELERTPFLSDEQKSHMVCLARAVRGGVTKAQLVSFEDDGALLAELFTAAGEGTQIVEQQSRTVRQAVAEDVAGIVEVIRPLEERGILVRRERDRLEEEISQFMVAELDGIVVGCCAVYPYGRQVELACLAVHENYRNQSGANLGQSLLDAAEQFARDEDADEMFVLTTQTMDWFLERGFEETKVDRLPAEKQSLYNWQRNSIVMTKRI